LDFDQNNVAYTVERKLELQPNNSLRYIGTFLQTIDITTGAVTEIGVIRTADGSLPQISAIAFTSVQITAVPEPSSCLLLGLMSLGTTVILARRRQTWRIVSPD
jgi:PEP-CTERM motif